MDTTAWIRVTQKNFPHKCWWEKKDWLSSFNWDRVSNPQHFIVKVNYLKNILIQTLFVEIKLISWKRFLQCALIQWRLSIYPWVHRYVAEGTIYWKSPVVLFIFSRYPSFFNVIKDKMPEAKCFSDGQSISIFLFQCGRSTRIQ